MQQLEKPNLGCPSHDIHQVHIDNSFHNKLNKSNRTVILLNRLIPPAYNDGISDPRIGYGGLPLPGARSITSVVHIEEGLNDHAATTLVVSWGQFMDHDFTLTGTMLSI